MNKKIQTLIFTSTLLLFLSSPSIAVIDDYQGAVDAYSREDYKTAYKLMLPLAEQGVAKAQYNLGLMYGKGKGIVKDDSKAIKWWKLAADQGDGKAQTNLGWMYEKGRGVNQDDQEAIKWYQLASDQGVAKAQEKLNVLLNKTKENLQENTASSSDSPSEIVADNIPLKGDAFAGARYNEETFTEAFASSSDSLPEIVADNIPLKGDAFVGARYSEETLTRAPDYINDSDRFHAAINSLDKKEFATAHQLFFDLAEKGVAEAQINLGMMFEDGQGVSQDFNEAIRWYRLAADQGLTKAQEKLNFLLKSKSQGNLQSSSIDSKSNYVNVTSDEIRDDSSVSRRFHTALSAFNKKEFDTAYQLFFELADKGIAEAQINLGMMFENGQGVPQDYGKAVRWYRHAADQGLIKAQYNLGLMYAYGKGVDKDPIEAIKWYRLAVDQGLIQAQTALGLMYKKGDGVTQDFKEAAKLYQLAAEQGDPDAQYQLGLMYSNGEGISQDYKEAAKWFQLAVEQGNMLAQGELDGLPGKKSLWEKIKDIF